VRNDEYDAGDVRTNLRHRRHSRRDQPSLQVDVYPAAPGGGRHARLPGRLRGPRAAIEGSRRVRALAAEGDESEGRRAARQPRRRLAQGRRRRLGRIRDAAVERLPHDHAFVHRRQTPTRRRASGARRAAHLPDRRVLPRRRRRVVSLPATLVRGRARHLRSRRSPARPERLLASDRGEEAGGVALVARSRLLRQLPRQACRLRSHAHRISSARAATRRRTPRTSGPASASSVSTPVAVTAAF